MSRALELRSLGSTRYLENFGIFIIVKFTEPLRLSYTAGDGRC